MKFLPAKNGNHTMSSNIPAALLLQIAVHRQTIISIMNNHKRRFNRGDNTQSSIHSQQLNTLQRQQPQPAYQRPKNTRRSTTPTTAAVLFTATAVSNEYYNTNDDNTIFNCNGGDTRQPPHKETWSTRGQSSSRRKRSYTSSTPPPSISVSTNTSSSKKIKYKHNNDGTSTSTSIVPNSFDSRYGLGTLSTNSKVSKSKPNYDTIRSLASSVSSLSSFNVFEENADSIVSQAVGGGRTVDFCADISTNASLEEEGIIQKKSKGISDEVLNGYYNKMGTPTALQEITQSILEASDDHVVLSILSEIITISAEHAQYTDLSIEENADRAAALRVSAEEKRVKLYNALVNVLGLKWANKINLEQFNPDTPFNGFVIERYPTTDDEGKGPDHMSCRNDNNGTIKTLLWTLARWCATEERRQENPDAEPANFIPKKQGVIDMYATSLIKEDSDKVKRD